MFLSFGVILSLKTEVKLPESNTAIGIFFLLNVFVGNWFSKMDKLIFVGVWIILDLSELDNKIVFWILFFIVSIELTKFVEIASIFFDIIFSFPAINGK